MPRTKNTPQSIVRKHWKACQTPPKEMKEKARQALARELDDNRFSVADLLRGEKYRTELRQCHPKGIKWEDALPSERQFIDGKTYRSQVLRTWSQWASDKPKKTAAKAQGKQNAAYTTIQKAAEALAEAERIRAREAEIQRTVRAVTNAAAWHGTRKRFPYLP